MPTATNPIRGVKEFLVYMTHNIDHNMETEHTYTTTH
jgi:hypothetical protein